MKDFISICLENSSKLQMWTATKLRSKLSTARHFLKFRTGQRNNKFTKSQLVLDILRFLSLYIQYVRDKR